MTRRGDVRLATVVVCVAAAGLVVTLKPVQSAAVLVSHWKLDEGSGTTTRDSAASRSGTLRNGAGWTAGRSGLAVNMDGVNDYLSLPSFDVAGRALTITAWVKNSGYPNGVAQQFVTKASDSSDQRTYWLIGQTNGDGQSLLRFRLRTGTTTTTLTASKGALPLNTWYHVAATYDGSRMRLYLDGIEVGSTAKTGWLARSSTAPVQIGRGPDGSNYLRGAIDDVRVYAAALTRYEITKVMAASEASNESGGSGGSGESGGSESGTPPPNQPPTVSLTGPANGASFAAGTTVTVSATAADPDGTVSRVRFYAGSTLIGTDTSSPYSVSWPTVPAGSYALTAVATDNAGATTTSSARTVTVATATPPSAPTPSNQPPVVSLTSPSSGAMFTAPATITVSASASDPDGSVTRVDFYRGTTLIASDTSSPYSVQWTNVAAGSYSLTAVARDNAGATTVSSTRDITVRAASMPTTAVFTPSSNHATAVDRYVIELFTAGANTTVANPVAIRDIGKPSISNGEIRADISSTILGLSPGSYVATVTAVGNSGSTQSAASPPFTR